LPSETDLTKAILLLIEQKLTASFADSTDREKLTAVSGNRYYRYQWTLRGAHLLLQTRTKVLNNELDEVFRRWYPKFRLKLREMEAEQKAA
jgi:hypothetical protein